MCKKIVGLRKGGKSVIDCQGKNDVMSQTAAVSNDVAVLHIPSKRKNQQLKDVGDKFLVITCTV